MDNDRVKALQDRTDAKLRYARVHLDEMKEHGFPDGGDFDRAHQESFLFHLLGVRDALQAELKLASRSKKSKELPVLYALERTKTSWYSTAKAMRDHSTHKGFVPRGYFIGGENDGKVKLKHPQSGQETQEHFVETFAGWLVLMQALVEQLRESALSKVKAGTPGS
jgi:hypothetical protein